MSGGEQSLGVKWAFAPGLDGIEEKSYTSQHDSTRAIRAGATGELNRLGTSPTIARKDAAG